MGLCEKVLTDSLKFDLPLVYIVQYLPRKSGKRSRHSDMGNRRSTLWSRIVVKRSCFMFQIRIAREWFNPRIPRRKDPRFFGLKKEHPRFLECFKAKLSSIRSLGSVVQKCGITPWSCRWFMVRFEHRFWQPASFWTLFSRHRASPSVLSVPSFSDVNIWTSIWKEIFRPGRIYNVLRFSP